MRYVRISALYFQHVFQYRGRIFVWFLISLFHPLIYLLFWRGSPEGFSDVMSYYLLFVVAGGLLFVHVDADAYEDIVQGQLSSYLMKPSSYLVMKFFSELPWRIIQGFFGTISLIIIASVFSLVPVSLQPWQMGIAIVITVLGYVLIFLYKMIILISALWFTDIGGLQQFSEMLLIVLAGFIMPIRYFPNWVASIAYISPFPYTIYFPVTAFQGLVRIEEFFVIVTAQFVWILVLYIVYATLWKNGIKKYSGIGQ